MPKTSVSLLKNAESSVQILGVPVTGTPYTSVLTKIDEFVTSSLKTGSKLVVTANPEIVMLAQDDLNYKKILQGADFVFADGQGLKLASKGLCIVPGRKVVQGLVESRKYKVFYLGGRDGAAEMMASKFEGDYDSGEMNIKLPKRNAEIVKKINAASPDILLVAYGAPWQEKWIWENKDQIKAKVAIGVGGAFDYLTGRAKLPPVWMERMGIEWLWRLVQEPWRWRRQLNLFRFALTVLA